MRRRLYFLLPSTSIAKQVVDELLLARIDAGHIHVLARDETNPDQLPNANLLQRSDVVHGVELGLTLGGATGVVAGVIAITFPPSGLDLGGGTLLACAIAGALMGAWLAGMIGTDVPNSRLRSFREAIERGEILMMVDVQKGRVDEITQMIKRHHPEADMHGIEPTIPAFP